MTQGQSQVKVLSAHEFARICRTTTRTLRFYDKKGLLKPAYTDQFTKYRYYYPEQARDFLRIKMLQHFDLPLRKIGDHIANKNEKAVLSTQMQLIIEEIKEKQNEYAFLQSMYTFLFENGGGDMDLQEELVGPFTLLCRKINKGDYNLIDIYIDELRQEIKPLGFTAGEGVAFYLTKKFQPKNTPLEIALIIKDKIPDVKLPDGIYIRELPKTKALVYTYTGPFGYLILIYQKLYQVIAERKINVTGNVFDIYLRGKSKYGNITKIVFPVG